MAPTFFSRINTNASRQAGHEHDNHVATPCPQNQSIPERQAVRTQQLSVRWPWQLVVRRTRIVQAQIQCVELTVGSPLCESNQSTTQLEVALLRKHQTASERH